MPAPWGLFGSGGGGKVKVDSADTTADYLQQKLNAGTGVSLTVLNPGGNESLEISTQQIIASFAAPTSTKTYPRNTVGAGGIGVQAEKSPGVELAALLPQVPTGAIVEVAFAIGGDLFGLSALNYLDVNPTVKVGNLGAAAKIISGSDLAYYGANGVRIALGMTTAFRWAGSVSDLYIGIAIRLAGLDASDSLLVYGSQIMAPPCCIDAKVWTGLGVIQLPITTLIVPP